MSSFFVVINDAKDIETTTKKQKNVNILWIFQYYYATIKQIIINTYKKAMCVLILLKEQYFVDSTAPS